MKKIRFSRTNAEVGLIFEELLKEIFEETANPGTVRYQETRGEYRPDFVIGNKDSEKWVDAKLREESVFCGANNTIEKYESKCSKLVIVYLIGDKDRDEMITDKTRIVSIQKFIEPMTIKNRYKLDAKFSYLESIVKAVDKAKSVMANE